MPAESHQRRETAGEPSHRSEHATEVNEPKGGQHQSDEGDSDPLFLQDESQQGSGEAREDSPRAQAGTAVTLVEGPDWVGEHREHECAQVEVHGQSPSVQPVESPPEE